MDCQVTAWYNTSYKSEFLREMAMADEKRQSGVCDIRHRIRISLLDTNSQAQALPYATWPAIASRIV